ncbi:hypothetical protein Aple_046330 [Acrocarpospora pleiomorpha]|uniref:CRISPR-associated protein Cas5 n=1 Tax=Acrocarpospora pleiomorpha TaxID=90975 RepID=A0A5M3XJV3_9ACTN|nr:CRISPR-associated protein Cas5 [Acrocarpospora pleiomorpha]GES21737.1 hypothetical protein Aple_046330 [Acrocarpospora pleiomorpha]
MTLALEVEVTAPVVSFRNPLYAGVQVGLPCPPPSAIGGLLASTVGGWAHMPIHTRFAVCFTAGGSGTDLETYHPLDAKGAKTSPTPKDREFLADIRLRLWLISDLDLWEGAFRRPVWPLRFGRSQDLASARTRRVVLNDGYGTQGQALIPADRSSAGALLRLPTSVSIDRANSIWKTYRYATTRGDVQIGGEYVTDQGQAVTMLDAVHPANYWPTS